MTATPLQGVLRHIRSLAAAGQFDELSDGELLIRFADAHDNTAFEALMRRHGPWVRGVCRRMLGNGPDLEDVFQATFLVLARKANSIRRQPSVGSWLYGVAFRLAQNQRRRLARRRRGERSLDGLAARAENKTMGDNPIEKASLRELGAILDEELQHLSKTHREALVLCHLEGLSVAEAAKRLGCPLPTVKSRLTRARELLRRRLEIRGVTISSVALAAVFAEQMARAAVPAKVLYSIVDAAIAFAACPAAGASVSVQAAALAKGMLKTTLSAKLLLALLAVATTAVVGVGAAFIPGPAPVPSKTIAPISFAKLSQLPAVDLVGDSLPTGALARLGSTRWHHSHFVRFAAFLPDGKSAISVSLDEIIHIWDCASGKELRAFGPGTQESVRYLTRCYDAALAPDGKTVVVSFDDYHEDRGARLWDVATGKELPPLDAQNNRSVRLVAFAPDGKHRATSDDTTIRIWDWAAGKEVNSFRKELKNGPSGTGALAFSPDGKTLLSAGHRSNGGPLIRTIQLLDASTGQVKNAFEARASSPVTTPAFSPNGRYLAYSSPGKALVIVDVAMGKEILKIEDNPDFIDVVFLWDSKKVLGRRLRSGIVQEWDIATGREIRKVGATNDLRSTNQSSNARLALSLDGSALLVVDNDHAVRFIDLKTGKGTGSSASSLPVKMVSFTPDGKQLLTQSEYAVVRRWDVLSGKELGHLAAGPVSRSCSASPDGRFFALLEIGKILDPKKGVDLWTAVIDAATSKVLGQVPSGSVAFAPDGKTLAVGEWQRDSVRIYDLPSLTPRCSVPVKTVERGFVGKQPEGSVGPFFSHDSRLLAASLDANTIGVWDATAGKKMGQIHAVGESIHRGTFSPDCRTVVLDNGDGTVGVWEIASGKQRNTFGSKSGVPKDQTPTRSYVYPYGLRSGTLDFSSDGALLAHSGLDKIVHVWEVATGKTVANFRGHTGAVICVAFSPDGTQLVSGSADTTALVWNLTGLKKPVSFPPKKMTDAELLAHWEKLAAPNAAAAFEAILALTADSVRTVPLLQQLKPALPIDGERARHWIAELDDENYKVRENAAAELRQLGEQLLPILEKALAANPTLELRRRVQAVRDHLISSTNLTLIGERLRLVRAVEVLERIGSPPARAVLQKLAEGPAGALETRTAQAALRRWSN